MDIWVTDRECGMCTISFRRDESDIPLAVRELVTHKGVTTNIGVFCLEETKMLYEKLGEFLNRAS